MADKLRASDFPLVQKGAAEDDLLTFSAIQIREKKLMGVAMTVTYKVYDEDELKKKEEESQATSISLNDSEDHALDSNIIHSDDEAAS